MNKPPKITCIYGGTFDPIHFGHLRSALEVAEWLDIQVKMIPSANPPHRPPTMFSAEERLHMLKLAIEGVDRLETDDRELRREGASYMVDTLLSFKEEDPDQNLVLILGDEAVAGLMGWDRWEQLLELAGLVVMKRPGKNAYTDELKKYLAPRWAEDRGVFMGETVGRVIEFEGTQIGISSTEIRSIHSQGKITSYLVPNCVNKYLRITRLDNKDL